MYTLAGFIQFLFPIIALTLLGTGLHRKAIYYVISSLWISLIALLIHYQSTGGQLLGDSFNYINAVLYTLNLLILIISLLRVITHLSIDHPLFAYISSFGKAILVMGSILVLTNVWINAYFIEHRMAGTPIMQVATFSKNDYCSYRYVFYKVDADGSVKYLCPNHYGLVPSTGTLSVSPDFIASQLSLPNKKQMLLPQKKS